MSVNSINLQRDGSLVIQDGQSGNVTIDTKNSADILQKLKQLNETQLAVIKQVANEHSNKLDDVFKTILSGVLSQKNIVHGNISAKSVKIGDTISCEFNIDNRTETKEKTVKELTSAIPKTSPDKIVGRDSELNDLHRRLFDNKQVVLVNGLGGIGKTTLAQVYIAKYWDEYRHVAWINQLSGNIINDFVDAEGLLRSLNIERTGKEPKELFNEILIKLKSIEEKPNLLIIDNADSSLSNLYNYLPNQPDWHILVTSRERINQFDLKELGFLSEKDAIDLFLSHYSYGKVNKEEIKELVSALDFHTLTIEILAKTAQKQHTEISQLKKALDDDMRVNVDIKHKGGKIEKVSSYLCSIFTMSKLEENEIWLMKQFTCLPPELHSYQRLKDLIKPEENQKEAIFSETIAELSAKGWLLQNEESDSYKMHRIIADVVKKQQTLTIDDIEPLIRSVYEKLSIDQTKDNPVDKFPWIPFGKSLLDHFPGNTDSSISRLQNNLATVLQALGDYEGAKNLLEKAMASDEKNFGPDHPTTAVSYSNLATVLQALGDYEGAKNLLEKAMASDEKNFGLDHPITARSYSNLALVLKDLGDYERALELSGKSLSIFQKVLPQGHPNIQIVSDIYESIKQQIKEQTVR